jgi:hypothetical protein
MSRLILNESAVPATPASTKVALYASNDANPHLRMIDDGGINRAISPINNWSVASQSPTATTRTYITGSGILIPIYKLRIGTKFRWTFNMTKTAAGIATSTIDIAFGTTGTVSDTARVSFTKPAGTAVADEGWVTIDAIVRGPLSASGVVAGHFNMTHNLAATGHAIIPIVDVQVQSSGFDVTTPTYVGLCITTGSADAITIQQCFADASNL